MTNREEIELFLKESGIVEENLTEKQMLKILRNIIDKCKIDSDCLEIDYHKNPEKMTKNDFIDILDKLELKKVKTYYYLLKVKQMQKDNRIGRRREVVKKVKQKILGR